MPNKSLTATNLAVHQHRNCDLYIHNVYHQNACSSRQDGGFMQTTNITKAQFKRGLDWESALYSWLDKSELLLKVPSIPISHSADPLLENILADDRTHFFITGLSFWPPQDKLAKRYEEAGTTPLHFGLAKPDLVEIQRNNGLIQWRVIDAKASKTVKTSHHIQIYFYTLCLSLLLRSPAFQPPQTAGVWLPPSDGYHVSSPSFSDIKTTSVTLLAPALDALLFRELPKVISAPVEKVKWHYNPLCQGCPYESSCKARAEAEGQLGTMANISVDDAQVLRDILRISRSTYAGSKEKVLADIEELHQLVANPAKFEQVHRASPALLKKGKRILGLPKKHGYQGVVAPSPLIEAARTKQLQIIQQRNYTCPRGEDIAIILTIISDPASSKPVGDFFCATVHSVIPYLTLPPSFTCPRSEFIPRLATLIRLIMTLRPDTSSGYACQFYVWTSSEQNILQGHIIDSALCSSADDEDIRLCIGVIAQGAALLQTAFQPTLLSGALMTFLGKGKQLKSDYQACLARLGLSREGTIDTLKKRINAEIQKIQGEMASSPGRDFGQRGFGQLPKVVPLMREVQRQLALPLPGYWDLPECVKILLPLERSCPTEEQVFSMFKLSKDSGDTQQLVSSLQERNRLIYSVLNEFRHVVTRSHQGLFVNEAKILTPSFMDICREPHIRKLFFMHQFEVLTKLTEFWKSRIEGCPEAPTLEFSNVTHGPNGPEYLFRLISGTVDVPPSDKDRAFYDKLIVWDDGSEHNSDGTDSENIPVEALFDDLAVSGYVFPLNRWAKMSWKKQHRRVQRELCVADIRNVYVDQQSQSTMIALRLWGNLDVTFTPGSTTFRLSPRLVDFNTSKILSALFEIDLRWESEGLMFASDDEEDDGHRGVPFLQLILSPESFGKVSNHVKYVKIEGDIQKLFRDLKDLGNTTAGSLVLKSSQHKAARRILTNRLSVVWGPPGTGKTYTITLSLLRMLDAERRHTGPRRMIVFITAITHAAIEACCSKLRRLMDAYRSIESLPHKWLDDVTLEVVNKGSDHRGPSMSGNGIYIYAGTLFQLSNFMKQRSFLVDCVIVDEAGQISLGAMSLVLRSLTFEGRVIFAGDSEQLAPILSAQYPQLKFGSLFGSVLDCLMFSAGHNRRQSILMRQASQDSELEAPASQATIVQLTENFRLNPDLGEFVSTIYSRRFKPQKVQARQLASALGSLLNDDDKHPGILPTVLQDIRKFLVALSDVMLTRHQTTLAPPELYSREPQEAPLEHRPVSLALIRLRSWSPSAQYITYESHVGAEAALAAGLVTLLRKCSPNDDIFVATPHRIQREAVNAALSWIEMKDNIDDLTAGMAHMGLRSHSKRPKVTVDTVERLQGSEAAFVICLFSLPRGYSADLGFLLERRRLNVAISRAKTLCILISSSDVLCPSVKILAQEETAKGYAFLKAFETRAWSCNISVNTRDVDGSHM